MDSWLPNLDPCSMNLDGISFVFLESSLCLQFEILCKKATQTYEQSVYYIIERNLRLGFDIDIDFDFVFRMRILDIAGSRSFGLFISRVSFISLRF